MKPNKFRLYSDSLKVMYSPDNQIGNLWSIPESPNGILRVRDDEILMQYIGLKDKNGKDIYEGDIAKMEVEYWGENFYLNGWHIGEVRIIASMGVCIYNPYFKNNNGEDYRQKGYWKLRGYRTEIIGNIYEHNHLINGQ